MQRLSLIILVLILCSGPGQAQQPEESPQRVEILHRWGDSGHTRIKLQSSKRSSVVKSVFLHTSLEKKGWRVDLEGQAGADGRDTEVEVSTRRRLLGESGTFLKWKHDNGRDRLEAGLESSVFGADKVRLTHRLAPLERDTDPRTELSYQRQLGRSHSLKALMATDREGEEVGGELLHEEDSGLMWGASVTTQRPATQQVWSGPTLEAKFRWTW